MKLGIVVLIGLLILVVTGLQIQHWANGAKYWELYSPAMTKLMAASPLLWIAGLILWSALARQWWKGRVSRFKVASAARFLEKGPVVGSALGGANTRYLRRNRLWQEADHKTGIGIGWSPLVGVLLALIVGVSLDPIAGVLAGLVAAAIGLSMLRRGSIVAAGAEGEDLAVQVIQTLPAGYTPFNQVRIPRADRSAIEADLIVVGAGVVHVIEIKHNKGEIQIRPDSPEWTVFKTGRKGGSYESSMRNPIKQVRGQVGALARYLKSQGIKQWVTGSVVLSHPEAEFEPMTHQDVAILRLDQLVAHVQSVRGQQGPSDTDAVVKAIARLIELEDRGPSPPSRRAPEAAHSNSLTDPSDQVSAELMIPPRRPPTPRSATSETRYWPVGYALVLTSTPWIVPSLSGWSYVTETWDISPPAAAIWSACAVAVHVAAIFWLNRCVLWLWVAAGVAATHVALANMIVDASGTEHLILLCLISTLYLVGCSVMQFFRFEYVFGAPLVPHHRVTYVETSAAVYETRLERDTFQDAVEGYETFNWTHERVKVQDAEFDVSGETWGRKGDGFSSLPAVSAPRLTRISAWSWAGALLVGAVLCLLTFAATMHREVCLIWRLDCGVQWGWAVLDPALALTGGGALMIVATFVLRCNRRT